MYSLLKLIILKDENKCTDFENPMPAAEFYGDYPGKVRK
jgi:hypothetical protein